VLILFCQACSYRQKILLRSKNQDNISAMMSAMQEKIVRIHPVGLLIFYMK
jgi:REP element-mobilizing transposase RayT